jgi:hypothetical protein
MSKFVHVDFPSYITTVMQAERPRFNPYVVRRERRLLLCVPGDDQTPIRTFELEPMELSRLLVGGHEALSATVRQEMNGEGA